MDKQGGVIKFVIIVISFIVVTAMILSFVDSITRSLMSADIEISIKERKEDKDGK